MRFIVFDHKMEYPPTEVEANSPEDAVARVTHDPSLPGITASVWGDFGCCWRVADPSEEVDMTVARLGVRIEDPMPMPFG